MGTVILALLVAGAGVALILLINKVGDWVDEKTGKWIGGFIAVLVVGALIILLTHAARHSGGG